MDSSIHNLNSLFAQLGLDSSNEGIETFIRSMEPIPKNLPLFQAEIWTESQAEFLKEAIDEDADWAEVVDHLDTMLRQ